MSIDNLEMMIGVFNIIVIPVVAGLLAHSVLYSPRPWAWHGGYGFGYWGARGLEALLGQIGYRFGFGETSSSFIHEANCRTVAFEVRMQN